MNDLLSAPLPGPASRLAEVGRALDDHAPARARAVLAELALLVGAAEWQDLAPAGASGTGSEGGGRERLPALARAAATLERSLEVQEYSTATDPALTGRIQDWCRSSLAALDAGLAAGHGLDSLADRMDREAEEGWGEYLRILDPGRDPVAEGSGTIAIDLELPQAEPEGLDGAAALDDPSDAAPVDLECLLFGSGSAAGSRGTPAARPRPASPPAAPPDPDPPAPSADDVDLFRAELEDSRGQFAAGLALLANAGSPAPAYPVLRCQFHKLSGAAAMLGLGRCAAVAARGEETLLAAEAGAALAPAQRQRIARLVEEVFQAAGLTFDPPPLPAGSSEPGAGFPEPAPAGRDGASPWPGHAVKTAPPPGRSLELVELDPDILDAFQADLEESVDAIEQSVLQWDQATDDRELVESIGRRLHTLKGASGSIGLTEVADLMHQLEDLLEARTGLDPRRAGPRPTALFFRAIDFLQDQSAVIRGQAPSGGPTLEQLAAMLREARTAIGPAEAAMGSARAARAAHSSALEPGRAAGMAAPGDRSGLPRSPAAPPRDESPRPAPAAAAPEHRPAPAAAAPEHRPAVPPPEAEDKFIRVDVRRLDRLMDLVSELVIQRNRFEGVHLGRMRSLDLEVNRCRDRLAADLERIQHPKPGAAAFIRGAAADGRAGGDPDPARQVPRRRSSRRPEGFGVLEFDDYDEWDVLTGRLAEAANDLMTIADSVRQLAAPLAEESQQMGRTAYRVWDELLDIRVVPVQQLFRRLVRPVREAAEAEGKQVEIVFRGEEVGMDRGLQDRLYDPLLHLVRNAVSHGIEAAGRRAAAGKPPAGRLVVEAIHDSTSITVVIADDGHGLDYAAIEAKGRRLGLIAAESRPGPEQLQSLIFLPRFSTRDQANQIAGRGIGMDVVAQSVAQARGRIKVSSQPGQGTSFALRFPLRFSLGQSLRVRVADQPIAIPMECVETGIPYTAADLAREGDVEMLRVRDSRLPVLRLRRLLELDRGPAPPAGSAVVVRAGERRFAVLVDAIEGPREIVIKSLGPLLADHPLFSGVSLSGQGQIVPILDIASLAAERAGFWAGPASPGLPVRAETPPAPGSRPAPPGAPRRALVVDDSVSVRKVAEDYLQSLGYEVELAADGIEALEKLHGRSFSVVFTDLEMPRASGFELLAEIRRRPALQGLPVFVVSTRAGGKHRRRAVELGVAGYLPKPFSRATLAQALASLEISAHRGTSGSEVQNPEPILT